MLTPELARSILHKVNLQINSNTLAIKPGPALNPLRMLSLALDTRRALQQLDRSYPG